MQTLVQVDVLNPCQGLCEKCLHGTMSQITTRLAIPFGQPVFATSAMPHQVPAQKRERLKVS
jgi:hypothetical protein